MKLKLKIIIIVFIIEIVLLILANAFINNYMFNTRMAAGSHAYYAPLLFSETRYSNSQLITDNFSIINLIINIFIVIIIPLIATIFLKSKSRSVK